MPTNVDELVARYRTLVERNLRGGLLDAEVDRLLDEQESIVVKLRAAVAPATVVELARSPWIAVR